MKWPWQRRRCSHQKSRILRTRVIGYPHRYLRLVSITCRCDDCGETLEEQIREAIAPVWARRLLSDAYERKTGEPYNLATDGNGMLEACCFLAEAVADMMPGQRQGYARGLVDAYLHRGSWRGIICWPEYEPLDKS